MQAPAVERQANRDPNGRFGAGNNIGGRTPGSRNALSNQFVDDLYEVWQENGKQILADLVETDKATLAKMVLTLLPKSVTMSAENDAQFSIHLDFTGFDGDEDSKGGRLIEHNADGEVADTLHDHTIED